MYGVLDEREEFGNIVMGFGKRTLNTLLMELQILHLKISMLKHLLIFMPLDSFLLIKITGV